MQPRFRNALLAVAVLAGTAFIPVQAHAQSAGSVTITVAAPTQFAGRVLAPGAYILRPATGQWFLTLEEKASHRTIGFVRYESVTERPTGGEAAVTAAALEDGAPAKFAITSVYVPATGREYWFAPRNPLRQIAVASSAGK